MVLVYVVLESFSSSLSILITLETMFLDFPQLRVTEIRMDENALRPPKNIVRNSLTTTAIRSSECLRRCTTLNVLHDNTVISMTIECNNPKGPIFLTAQFLVKEKGASPKTRDT